MLCRVKLGCVCTALAAVCLAMACPPTVAESPTSEKRILLLYGDRRVEYVVQPESPAETREPAGSRPDQASGGRTSGGYPVVGLRPGGSTVEGGADEGFRDDHCSLGRVVSQPREALGLGVINPLRSRSERPTQYARVPFEDVKRPGLSFPSAAAQQEEKRSPSEQPFTAQPAALPETRQADDQAVAPAAPPTNGPIRTQRLGGSSGDAGSKRIAESASWSGWIAAGIVQAAGTLIGLFIGMSVFLAASLLVLRRLRGTKLEPIIRVEMPNLPLAARSGEAPPLAREAKSDPPPDASRPTLVGDFGDQCVSIRPPGKTYDEQQRARTAERKQQEEEILKQIFEDNVALRGRISMPIGAA